MLTAEQKRSMLERIMEHYGIFTQAELARKMGISAQNVNSWLTRGTFNVELVAVKCPELSGDWLLTGAEPMLKADRPLQDGSVAPTDIRKAVDAIAAEQRLTAKAQAQADKILAILNTLAESVKQLRNQK